MFFLLMSWGDLGDISYRWNFIAIFRTMFIGGQTYIKFYRSIFSKFRWLYFFSTIPSIFRGFKIIFYHFKLYCKLCSLDSICGTVHCRILCLNRVSYIRYLLHDSCLSSINFHVTTTVGQFDFWFYQIVIVSILHSSI